MILVHFTVTGLGLSEVSTEFFLICEKKLTVMGQWSDIVGEKSPTWKFKMLFKKDALQIYTVIFNCSSIIVMICCQLSPLYMAIVLPFNILSWLLVHISSKDLL
jgi:hypothetical protein